MTASEHPLPCHRASAWSGVHPLGDKREISWVRIPRALSWGIGGPERGSSMLWVQAACTGFCSDTHPQLGSEHGRTSLVPRRRTSSSHSQRRRQMTVSPFMFATGIENSYPTINNGRTRIDEMDKCGHYEKWCTDFN